ncbi:ABC transporter permease [Halomarina salina]|uniref:ABC transporter permease n=1 Tax=Halomarina salina TaxID=1872699 RepID=A0ABD5RHX9_9EURY|nr:ABC transporter permease [Halomarina salina]
MVSVSRRLLVTALLSLVVLGVLWFVRPWFQPLAYALFVESPGVLQWLAVVALLLGAYVAYGARNGWPGSGVRVETDAGRVPLPIVVAGFLVVLAIVGGSVVGGLYEAEATSERVGAAVTDVDTLPETSAERARVLPQSVARAYAQNSLQSPQFRLAGGDISVVNGTPKWSYALAPDGGINSYRLKQRGAVFVDMTTTSSNVTVREGEFQVGQGMAVTDDYEWQLAKHAYFRDYRDPFVVPHGDEMFLAVPYVTHDWEFRATPLPQLHSVPEFGGVSLVAQNGSITDLSPEEARSSEVLAGQNFYPYELARHEVASRAYQNGILNTWFTHEDQLELAPVPGENDQPFTVFTEDGPTYVLAAEPWGDAAGVYQLWTIDGRSGEPQRLTFSQSEALLGPSKATDYAMRTPDVARLNDVSPAEPIPVVRDGRLYWQVHVVPNSSAGLSYIAFVDARSGDVYTVGTGSEAKAFLAGESVQPGGSGNQSGGGTGGVGSGDGLVIVVEREDGSTERVTVGPNDSVVIRQRGGQDTRGNATTNGTAARSVAD